MDAHPQAKALILTSCTYDGFRYDLAPIIEAAHARGIKVTVDEAWYGCARFHPALRPTALECGADYATQSTHKVLSAFSQASMIHVNDPDFNGHLFRENLNMHTSTSPQYGLIASLDVARKQAVMEGYKLLSRTLQLAQELRERIKERLQARRQAQTGAAQPPADSAPAMALPGDYTFNVEHGGLAR